MLLGLPESPGGVHAFVLSFSICLALALTGCSKPPTSSSGDTAANETQTANEKSSSNSVGEQNEAERKEARHLVVPSGTAITISLGSTIGSKVSRPGDTFSGSVAKEVMVGSVVAIPKGANITGTVTDAKPLGRFKGGALLQVRLDSIRIHGADV